MVEHKYVYTLSNDSYYSNVHCFNDPIESIDRIYKELLSDIKIFRKLKYFKGPILIYDSKDNKDVRLTKASLLKQIRKQTDKDDHLYLIIKSNVLTSDKQIGWRLQRNIVL